MQTLSPCQVGSPSEPLSSSLGWRRDDISSLPGSSKEEAWRPVLPGECTAVGALRPGSGPRVFGRVGPRGGRLEPGWNGAAPPGGFVTPLSETRCHRLQQSLGSGDTVYCQEPQRSGCSEQQAPGGSSSPARAGASVPHQSSHWAFSPLAPQRCFPGLCLLVTSQR